MARKEEIIYRKGGKKRGKPGIQKQKKEKISKEACPVELLSFQAAAKGWLKSIQKNIKESTYVKYSSLLNCYILPMLGEEAVQTLSQETIEAACFDLLESGGKKGRGLSPKTVSDCLSLIRSILQYSAVRGIYPLCNAKSVTVKQRPREMRVLTRKEQNVLSEYLSAHPSEKNIGILICLFTGLRIGEICALKWKDISLTEQTLHVCATMQRIHDYNDSGKKTKILISTPKSSCSVRTIPLPLGLAELLQGCERPAEAYVLTGREDKFIEPRTMQNHFQSVIRKCALDTVNFHVLRHTFATRCVELGFDIKSLSEILGHASVNITMNRYVHPSMELKRENMMRLSELISAK